MHRPIIVIRDADAARAAWVRSNLLPFMEEGDELHISCEGSAPRTDILILSDPQSSEDAALTGENIGVKVRYALTRQAWRSISLIPYETTVTLLCGNRGVFGALRDALAHFDRSDIKLHALGEDFQESPWKACCRLGIPPHAARAPSEQEIDLPIVSPGCILDLLRRLGRLDGGVCKVLGDYLWRVACSPADSGAFLDLAFATRARLDRALSICGRAVIELDHRDVAVYVGGPITGLLGRHRTEILGRSIREACPEIAALAMGSSSTERHLVVNGHALRLRTAPIALEDADVGGSLLVLKPSEEAHSRRDPRPMLGEHGARHCLANIIGTTPEIERARQLALRAGRSDCSVLIIGESGTGKELFAQAMHNVSARASGPFIPINCAAIPESLIETELFGYEGGAFTGARKQGHPSLFERADGGTIFLDELSDMSPHVQAALLRVLEEHAVTRVGGGRRISVDVRVIAATNSPLEELVSDGRFRRDLYHRLCVIPLWVPPLRERRSDIAMLARKFLADCGDQRPLPDEVLNYLRRYRWPGNVRELQHCLEYMVTFADGPFTVADLPPHIQPYIQITAADREPQASNVESAPRDPQDDELDPHSHGSGRRPLDEGCYAILAIIEAANHAGVGIGRRALAGEARRNGFALTEGAVRTRLISLRADGLVQWGLGRAGVHVTAKGARLLRQRGGL